MRKVVLVNPDDPHNLCDIFDGDRITPDGEIYRVAQGVNEWDLDRVWMNYERGEHEKRTV